MIEVPVRMWYFHENQQADAALAVIAPRLPSLPFYLAFPWIFYPWAQSSFPASALLS